MEANLQVVCPRCSAINRVPRDRLAQHPVCGKCRSPLLPGQPLHLDAPALARLVDKGDLPLLVDFWAPWCGPCRTMAPAFEQAAGQLAPGVILAKVNTEEQKDLGQRYGIQSIPTLVLFKGGRDQARVSGALPAAAIVEWTRKHL
jgi:thioredoxin 2